MPTQQIKIGSKFFEKELQVYANWAEAWWRENIQNSVDAGASRLDITTKQMDNGSTVVTFADDGSGMSRETLESIYFILGETGKGGVDSIGGFGKARILTCFAQHQYTLHTGNLYVVGSGADYEIREIPEYQRGVKLVVNVKNDEQAMLSALHDYLELCYLKRRDYTDYPVKVFINGTAWKNWTYARNLKRELSFGQVYTNHSKDARLLVRVSGTLMFAKYINSPAQVILEINPNESRKVLLANRDGLVWDKQRELESFITELNINRRSALKRKTNKSTTFKGKGTFAMKRKGMVVSIGGKKRVVEPLKFAGMAKVEMTPGGLVAVPVESRPVVEQVETDGPELKEPLTNYQAPPDEDGPEHAVAPQPYHDRLGTQTQHEEFDVTVDLFDVKIDDDTDNPRIKRVIDSYDPRNWDLAGNGYRVRNGERQYFRAGVDKYKLLVMWKAAVEKAMEILLNKFPQAADGYNWGVGWVFSDFESGEGYRTNARHATEGDVHYFLINPVEEDGTMKYSLSSKDDLHRLATYAAHEVVHLVCDMHDEDWASLYTELNAVLSPEMPRIINAMREAKEKAVKALETAGA